MMSNDFISVNDELQQIKVIAKNYNKEVVKIEKVGNANMSAFKIFYKEKNSEEVKENFFWRHDMEKLISIFSAD